MCTKARLARAAILHGLACLVTLSSATVAHAGEGDPDPLFGNAGKLLRRYSTLGVDRDTDGRAAVVQPDGKIIAVAVVNGSSAGVFRMLPDGSPDTTFSTDGETLIDLDLSTTSDTPNSVVVQPDGKIVVTGSHYNGSAYQGFVTRLMPNGAEDASFGVGGHFVYPASTTSGGVDLVSLVVLPDGRLVATGGFDALDESMINVLISSSGSLIGASIANTLVSATFNGDTFLQPDGKLVVVMTQSPDLLCTVARFAIGATAVAADSTFSGDGELVIDWNTDQRNPCNAGALQADGKIVVAGHAVLDVNGTERVAVTRVNVNGTLDAVFGKQMFGFQSVAVGISNRAQAVLIQPDQRIVIAGGAGTSVSLREPSDFGIRRLLTDGAIDATFVSATPGSTLGTSIIGFETTLGGRHENARSLLWTDNRIVAVGWQQEEGGAAHALALVRLRGENLFEDGFE
jgi:uncharacterized delta-60 repeat protein